jgi:hypothetical protein
MACSFVSHYVHIVFGTKDRVHSIREEKTSLLPGFGFSLGFSFSLFRSQRPYRIGAHRTKCRKIQSDQ